MLLEAYPMIIPMKSIIVNIIFWGLVYVLYKNKSKSKETAGLWRLVSTFLAVLLATLGANYAKKEIKEWWNKK